VFTDAVGRPLRPYNVSYAFQRARAAAGLPLVRFHDLRHSAATLLLAEGVPLIVISNVLGHSGIAITASHYAAIVPELRREAADAMDRALGGAEG
jgi:integrase